jgi:hypothetical protein
VPRGSGRRRLAPRRIGRPRRDGGRSRRLRAAGHLPAESLEVALGLHEALRVRRVPEEDLSELLTAPPETGRDCLDLLADPQRLEGACRGREVLGQIDLPRDVDRTREAQERPRRRGAPERAAHTPLTDVEGPGELRRRIDVELGPPVEHDLRDAEILREVEFLVPARREDVPVLLDARELPGAVGAGPLVADVIDGTLGAKGIGGAERRGVRRYERGHSETEAGVPDRRAGEALQAARRVDRLGLGRGATAR